MITITRRKILFSLFMGLAVVVEVTVLYVASHHRIHSWSGDDWYILLLPIIMPIICIVSSVLLYRKPENVDPVKSGLLWGFYVGANGFMVLMAVLLFPNVQSVSGDGTAYWGLLFIPSFWLGLPAMFIGATVGMSAGYFVKRKGRTASTACPGKKPLF